MNGSAAELGALRVYPTADGSFSLHSDHFGEAFHNSAGALNEARAKFVQPAELQRFSSGSDLRILDVCLGLGYNTAAVLEALPTPGPKLQWWGLELDRRPLEQALEQASFQSLWSAPVLARLEDIRDHGCWKEPGGWQENNSQGIQLWGDARSMLKQIPESVRFDLVLLDAFSPQRCPELWSEEFLGALAQRLAPQGRLLTYSRSAAVRASLKRAGLSLYSLLPAPGERVGGAAGPWPRPQTPVVLQTALVGAPSRRWSGNTCRPGRPCHFVIPRATPQLKTSLSAAALNRSIAVMNPPMPGKGAGAGTVRPEPGRFRPSSPRSACLP